MQVLRALALLRQTALRRVARTMIEPRNRNSHILEYFNRFR